MPKLGGYPIDEGMVEHKVGGPTRRFDAKQPKGPKAKGPGKGSQTVGGVTFRGKAARYATNDGNYNEVGSKAKQFG